MFFSWATLKPLWSLLYSIILYDDITIQVTVITIASMFIPQYKSLLHQCLHYNASHSGYYYIIVYITIQVTVITITGER